MYQGLDQDAVLDPYLFIKIQDKIDALITDTISFGFEFIASDITFIKNRIVNWAIAQKIAAGQIRTAKMEMERVMRGHAVKCIEFD